MAQSLADLWSVWGRCDCKVCKAADDHVIIKAKIQDKEGTPAKQPAAKAEIQDKEGTTPVKAKIQDKKGIQRSLKRLGTSHSSDMAMPCSTMASSATLVKRTK